MKKFTVLLVMILAWMGMSSAMGGAKNSAPEIAFVTAAHDFGTIKEADGMVSCDFEFSNKGTAPLVITSATASCGCTKPEYSEKPIAPGKSSSVKVSFSPKGRIGEFSKNITIRTNDPAHKKVVLRIYGVVVP